MRQTQPEEHFTKQMVWTPKNVNHERQRLKSTSRKKESKERWQLDTTAGSGLDPASGKNNGKKDIAKPTDKTGYY